MIYHYRTVPANYAAKGVVDAPLMPAYGGPIRAHLDQMKIQVSALQLKLSTTGAARNAGAAGTFSQEPTAQGATSALGTTSTFSQNTSALETNFSQGTSVSASSVMQSCCGAQVQVLQISVGLLEQQVLSFSSKFRNLNLLFVGLNMSSNLANKAQAIIQFFMTLKQAPDRQTALAALQSMSSQLSSASHAIDSGFQDLSAGNAAAQKAKEALNTPIHF
jgi:hypothetical protein